MSAAKSEAVENPIHHQLQEHQVTDARTSKATNGNAKTAAGDRQQTGS